MKSGNFITSKLNIKALIQKQIQSPDEAGGMDVAWADKFYVYVYISSIDKRYLAPIAKSTKISNLYNIIMRKCDIDMSDRILINDKYFDIESVTEAISDNNLLEVVCKEIC